MRYGVSLLSGNTYHSNSYGGDSQTRHHYPTHTSPDSIIIMNKVFGILLVSWLMAIFAISGAAFAKNWNTSNESTLAYRNKDKKLFKSAEHVIDWENQSSTVSSLNQLFYPKEILASFSKISQSK